MTIRFIREALPTRPAPCGQSADPASATWQAESGRCPGEALAGAGVCAGPAPCATLAAAPWTLECWLTWPEGVTPLRKPAVLAEASGPGWSWTWGFDHVGAMTLIGRAGDNVKVVAGDILIDSVHPGRWYHAAVAMNAEGDCRLYFTPEGEALARPTGGPRQKLDVPGPTPAGPVVLSIGRSAASAEPPAIRIGSAALRGCTCGVEDFPALGGAPVDAASGCVSPRTDKDGKRPEAASTNGVVIDAVLEYANLGRAFAIAPDAIVFSPGAKESIWWSFRARTQPGRTVRFFCFKSISAFVSEDGGRSWRPPSGGTWRTFDEWSMEFSHTFAGEEAIFAASPPVTADMAEAWIQRTAARFGGRVRTVGASRLGRPLKVVEVGNADAPLVYLQAGQHSMEERLGFFTITAALEAAAQDADLMSRTRWAVMPLVNVDSYKVGPPDGNMNRFWGKDDPPPTVAALARFLKEETDRTGGLVMGDWHSGPVFRGVTILDETTRGFSDPKGNWNSLHLRRESAYPELESCLREAGLRFTVLNGYERNRATHGNMGYFEDYTVHFRGVRDPLCVELSPIVIETAGGAEPVSPENLRADGARWCRAIKKFIDMQK